MEEYCSRKDSMNGNKKGYTLIEIIASISLILLIVPILFQCIIMVTDFQRRHEDNILLFEIREETRRFIEKEVFRANDLKWIKDDKKLLIYYQYYDKDWRHTDSINSINFMPATKKLFFNTGAFNGGYEFSDYVVDFKLIEKTERNAVIYVKFAKGREVKVLNQKIFFKKRKEEKF